MKYLSFAFLVLASCKQEADEIFEMSFTLDNAIFEAGSSQFQVYHIDSYDIDTRIMEYLAANGRTRDEIKSIIPKSAELANIQTNTSLDFIQNIKLSVFDGSPFSPDIMENLTEIFFRDNVPQDQKTFIDLLPSLPDVKDQLLKDRFNISIEAQLRVPPPNTIEARMKLRFSVQ